MSHNIQQQKSELFIDVSEQEQEVLSGGRSSSPFGLFYLFYQNTNILTSGSSEVNISLGNSIGSAKSQSAYQFSQTTLIFAAFFGSGNRRSSWLRGGSNFLSSIMGLF
ncbi:MULTISPECIES: hypothetical protein [unclassified Tolypothrix]|uniref:hypothetical protein n=1 Tax=unclassified Tolypothrix TaxID=2649714 RepID=UPI000694C420|nr:MULTISPECIES: hypothetical protein [unclassified Tolypothrix]MBE9082401.1 hypothetical protein [Tolypothrix sp. LEGE 11397]UYD27405.1 hypothetical protein HGR01_04755 [Tolypothrix sp. PCC 7712]UYD36730.1 hypothetical protein HG267_13955 [Tolypothrix sp. PCC 7601]BAY93578.1 hypothetical protein NIES3275_56180 [Microchaete diplosiphon NIES-3275]